MKTALIIILLMTISGCANRLDSGLQLNVIEFAGNKAFFVKARNEDGYYLVDTGSSGVLWNSKYIESSDLGEKEEIVETPSGKAIVRHYDNKIIRLENVTFRLGVNSETRAADLSVVEKRLPIKLQGILGLAILSGLVISYSKKSNVAYLYSSIEKIDKDLTLFKKYRLNSRAEISKISINGSLLENVMLDTGLTVNGLREEDAADIVRNCSGEFRRSVSLSGENKKYRWECKNVNVDKNRYSSLFFDIQPKNTLGMHFLVKNDFILDYPSRAVYLKLGSTN